MKAAVDFRGKFFLCQLNQIDMTMSVNASSLRIFCLFIVQSGRRNGKGIKATFFISETQLVQQFLYIGGLQDLAHGNYLLIDHQSRHTHNAILHDLLHISHILDFDCKTQILYRSLGCFIQIVAVLAAGTQNLDGVLTAVASILCLGRRATATADLFCLGCSAAAAATCPCRGAHIMAY